MKFPPVSNLPFPRSEFFDHPGWHTNPKDPEAMLGNRPKVFCKLCWVVGWQRAVQQDNQDIQEGRRHEIRSEDQIFESLWDEQADTVTQRIGWIQGRADTLSRHLKNCGNIPNQVHDQASIFLVEHGYNKSPQKREQNVARGSSLTLDPMSHDSSPGTLLFPQPPSFTPHSEFLTPFSADAAIPPSTTLSYNRSLISPALSGISSLAGSPSLGLSSFPHDPTSHFLQGSSMSHSHDAKSAKCRRTGLKRTASNASIASSTLPVWNPQLQQRFSLRIARLTASCGFPLLWVENPEFHAFCNEFIPGSEPISRRALTRTWIPKAVKAFRDQAKEKTRNSPWYSLGTMQFDGYTAGNHHHFIGFMVTTNERKIYTVYVHDASDERKSAENLKKLIYYVRNLIESEWNLTVIALTSDGAGESSKARKDVVKDCPELIGPDCYAHQIALISGDYFKQEKTAPFLEYSEKASNLITWLRSKTLLLAHLRKSQETMAAMRPGGKGKILSVIRPVITRWSSHYMAYSCLLELKRPLEYIVSDEKEAKEPKDHFIRIGNKSAREKGQEMMDLIENSLFWHSIARIKKHLEPLARASCIMQEAHARLDHVPIVFGTLMKEYLTMAKTDGDPDGLIQAIIESIEKRWAKSDQDVFILAIVLHPGLKKAPFRTDLTKLVDLSLWEILGRLWTRFYHESPPSNLYAELQEYLQGRGVYSSLTSYISTLTNPTDPLELYKGIYLSNSPLQRIAIRLLSVCSNSASCERLFSMFGITLSRLRSRMSANVMVNLAELRMHLRDLHASQGLIKERLKRNMTSHAAASTGDNTVIISGPPCEELPRFNDLEDEPELTMDLLTEATQPSSVDTSAQRNTSASQSLKTFAIKMAAAANLDDQETTVNNDGTLITIEELFDFNNPYWINATNQSSISDLDAEMELHELLDLDADGDDEEELNDITRASL